MNKSTNQQSILHLLFSFFQKGRSENTLGQINQRHSVSFEEDSKEKNESPMLSNTFERIEEYKAILENHAEVSARRQRTNDIFVGLNTVFLTALGFLLAHGMRNEMTASERRSRD